MGSNSARNVALFFSTLVLLLVGFARSDLNQDKAECTDKLLGLASCLAYVSGQSKAAPTLDCCSGLKNVIDKSKRCLCILIKDHDDPNLGVNINVSLALNLPTTCHTPTNITQCVDLLHLAPNSSQAKIFEGFEKALTNTSTPTASAGTNTQSKSDGERWVMKEVLWGILPFVLVSQLLLFFIE